MFAGKTTLLHRYAKSLPENSYLIVKPAIDDRYSQNHTTTHNGEKLEAVNVPIDNPYLNGEVTPLIKTVLFDEVNFYGLDNLSPLIENLLQRGINVIGAGLSYDFRKQPFGATLPLSEKAQKVFWLTAKCDGCGKPAEHSYRKVGFDEQVKVGASDLYGACCDECWEELNNEL